MSSYVKSIKATGIYGRFMIPLVKFQSGVNILHGRNGTGKTTLLHILANILNGDYTRFAHLRFQSIEVELDKGRNVRLEREQEGDDPNILVYIDENLEHRFPVKAARERFMQLHQVQLEELSSSARRQYLEEMKMEEMRMEGRNIPKPSKPLLKTAYFPAFRTMIEAWAAMLEEQSGRSRSERWETLATQRAREWFGNFVPTVNFPSLLEIESELARQIASSSAEVWRQDRNLLTKAFLDIFKALSEEDHGVEERPDVILAGIKEIFDRLEQSPLKAESMILTEIYGELRELINKSEFGEEAGATAVRILNVYRQMLADIATVQESAFEGVKRYLSSVNEFLENKSLVVNPDYPRLRRESIGIRFADGSYVNGLRALSSGERQIVTLMYAATHMSEQRVVLIDEPEISLHVDWQSPLLRRMSEHLGDRQIIACTHSPIIGEDYEERMKRLQLKAMKSTDTVGEEDIEEAEEEMEL